MPLIWNTDAPTQYWAQTCILPLRSTDPRPQDPGHNVSEAKLRDEFGLDAFPACCSNDVKPGYVVCGPDEVIACFRGNHDLHAVALVAAWGGMRRPAPLNRILARGTEAITSGVSDARQALIDASNGNTDAQDAWEALTGPADQSPRWTHVMTSKTLHFLCRSLGIDDPPLPIDNAAAIEGARRRFTSDVQQARDAENHLHPAPGSWNTDTHDWEPFSRYMTAIRTWAAARDWSAGDFEQTMFFDYS